MEHTQKGMNFTDGLALLLIGLKLAKVIDWSWVWVLSPLWISVVIVVVAWALAQIKTN